MDNKDDIIVELKEQQKIHLNYAKAMTNIPLETIVKSTKSAMIKKYECVPKPLELKLKD